MDSGEFNENFTFYVTLGQDLGLIIPKTLYNCEIFNKKWGKMDVESTMLPLGTKLPEFNLKGIDEQYYKNSDFSENNGLLVMFICNHCPFVKHINDGLVDFTNDLIAKNIGVIGINSNDSSQEKYAEDSIEKMKEYAAELGLSLIHISEPTRPY